MKNKVYDLVFLTHLPSFYKINLYSSLSSKLKIAAIFIGTKSEIRTDDFTSSINNFDSFFLTNAPFERRKKTESLFALHKILSTLQYKFLIVGGWEEPEFWYAAIKSGKHRAGNALESTIFESKIGVCHLAIKKLFCRLISHSFPSGTPHYLLLKALSFKGEPHITGGVGLTNYTPSTTKQNTQKCFSGNLLFVGRLSPEKNIEFLLECISLDERLNLTIIGDGPLRNQLEKKACPRVKFLGHIENSKLRSHFESSDAIVLTSHRETWGLVIEEAAYYGCPSIVHTGIGCSIDFVCRENIGLLYTKNSHSSFLECVQRMFNKKIYAALLESCGQTLHTAREKNQTSVYFDFISRPYENHYKNPYQP